MTLSILGVMCGFMMMLMISYMEELQARLMSELEGNGGGNCTIAGNMTTEK
jgi:hypothetical protein